MNYMRRSLLLSLKLKSKAIAILIDDYLDGMLWSACPWNMQNRHIPCSYRNVLRYSALWLDDNAVRNFSYIL
ncbi:hypothetical protein IMCC21906_00387 [Spongiibacter sp. IMCC21906]|nr:hypothetical protein IMCC21906_00387 [Spongiibacter sp. IMCC21906]